MTRSFRLGSDSTGRLRLFDDWWGSHSGGGGGGGTGGGERDRFREEFVQSRQHLVRVLHDVGGDQRVIVNLRERAYSRGSA